jgi:putative heme degradation protein
VELFQVCCAQDLEGIVIKAARGPYGTPRSWLKVINPNYSQHRGRREMFDKFRERRKPETDSHVLMSLEFADDGCSVTRIKSGQNSSSCKLHISGDGMWITES